MKKPKKERWDMKVPLELAQMMSEEDSGALRGFAKQAVRQALLDFAEELEKLIAKWRKEAIETQEARFEDGDLESCADELQRVAQAARERAGKL